MNTILPVSEITALATRMGIDPARAIQAFEASAAATAQSLRTLREWQHRNQEQATIVSDILMQHEGDASVYDL